MVIVKTSDLKDVIEMAMGFAKLVDIEITDDGVMIRGLNQYSNVSIQFLVKYVGAGAE